MAVDVTVVRYLGDKPGDDIADPLLSTEAAAIARGFGELNSRSVAHRDITIDCQYTTNLELGQILSATDSLSSLPIVGRLTGIRVFGTKREPDGGGEPELGMNLTLESPTDFIEV